MTILALWAAPRTVSTAFERMMIERNDHLVLDEPFSRAYYFGPDRCSDRYPLTMPEATYRAVFEGILAAADADGAVFVKDMAYQAEPGLPDDALAAFSHTFLIRDPAAALRSLYGAWPNTTEEESGFAALHRLFDRVRDRPGPDPVVIDSDDLRRDPADVVRAWCDAVDIDYRPESLTWDAGMRPEWPLWRDWYEGVAASTGFAPPTSPPAVRGPRTRDPADRDPDAAAVARARRHYEALAAARLR